MKKRLFSLVLALALCLGLITPATAAGTSGLDAVSAKAFYNALAAYGQQNVYVAYAGLKDMDGDNVPEMIVVTVSKEDSAEYYYHEATVDIWRSRNGQVVKGASENFGTFRDCYMTYATQNGKTYVHVTTKLWTEIIDNIFSDYMSVDGVYERLAGGIERDVSENVEYTRTINGTTTAITQQQYEQYQKQYLDSSDYIVEINGASWPTDGDHHSSYQNILSQLNVKASTMPAPAAGTYGPYTITGVMYDGSPYEVSFSAAKVEQKTVQVREYYDIGGDYSSYQNKAVTLVTIRPDTNVTVSSSNVEGVPVEIGTVDGNSKYTKMVFGVVQYIHNGIGKQSFEWDLTPDCVQLDDYLIYEDAAAYTNGGFTDVKTGAYYADAVKWAVDNKITSGTSATAFSPDSTCTVEEILTFLWRANGSPEPAGRNPFSDISSSDYFYKAAIWAADKGLVSGSKFNGNTPCTRSMVVTYLWKLAGSPGMNVAGSYGPQTITGTAFDHFVETPAPCTIEFSAASIKESTVDIRSYDYDNNGNLYDKIDKQKVVLITVAPGSKMTVKNAPLMIEGVPFLWEIELREDNEGYFDIGKTRVYSERSSMVFAGTETEQYHAWLLDAHDKRSGNPYMIYVGSNASSFTDLPSNAAYAQAVAWAVSQEITEGTSDTTFSPNATCTRGQIMTFLYRAMGE